MLLQISMEASIARRRGRPCIFSLYLQPGKVYGATDERLVPPGVSPSRSASGSRSSLWPTSHTPTSNCDRREKSRTTERHVISQCVMEPIPIYMSSVFSGLNTSICSLTHTHNFIQVFSLATWHMHANQQRRTTSRRRFIGHLLSLCRTLQ